MHRYAPVRDLVRGELIRTPGFFKRYQFTSNELLNTSAAALAEPNRCYRDNSGEATA